MAKERTFTVEDTTDEMILDELKKVTRLLEDVVYLLGRTQSSPS